MEIFTYHWLSPKVLSLDKTKKNKIFFCIVLAYSYLWPHKNVNLQSFNNN